MCSPTIGGGPLIIPGVSEKSMSDPNWRMRPSSGWSYSATRPRRSLSPSNSTRSPALGSIAISFGMPTASTSTTTRSRSRREARLQQRLELPPVLGPGRRGREARIGRELGYAERGAQRGPVRVFQRRDLEPALLRLVQAVQRVGTGLRLVEAGARVRRAVDEDRVGRRTSSRRRATTSRAPGLRHSPSGGTARRGNRRRRASRLVVSVIPKRR